MNGVELLFIFTGLIIAYPLWMILTPKEYWFLHRLQGANK